MHRRTRAKILVVFTLIGLLAQTTAALATLGYQGGGAWGSSSITYKIYATGTYATAASDAMTNWSDTTDVTLTATSPGYEHIAVYTWSGYESDPYGFTQMCTTGACWDPLPWDSLYLYGEVFGNLTRISAWATTKKQYLFAHEIGHALSLGHSDVPGDLMYGTCCTTYEDYGVYRTTWTEISAINARY